MVAKIFDRLDFEIDEDGNLSTINGDIARASSLDSMRRTIEWRMKTHPREWVTANPFVAAGLGDFQGRKNTRENAEQIEQRVRNALGSDMFIDPRNLIVEVVPIDAETINIYVKVRNFYALDVTETSDVEFPYRFSFNEGEITSLTGGLR